MPITKSRGGKAEGPDSPTPNKRPTLDQVKPGNGGVIAAIGGEGALRRRLLDMGLTPKTFVAVRKVAPMGDPIEIFLRSYVLTIRKEEASKIELLDIVKS